jgi:hypothetical protein
LIIEVDSLLNDMVASLPKCAIPEEHR